MHRGSIKHHAILTGLAGSDIFSFRINFTQF